VREGRGGEGRDTGREDIAEEWRPRMGTGGARDASEGAGEPRRDI